MLKSEVVEAEIWYYGAGYSNVIVSDNLLEIYNALLSRSHPYFEIGQVESQMEANIACKQIYTNLTYGMQNPNYEIMDFEPVGQFSLQVLPTQNIGNEILQEQKDMPALTFANLVENPIINANNQNENDCFGGIWGISCANGFLIRNSMEDMLYAIQDSNYIYPVARWYQNYQTAVSYTYRHYMDRLCRRYNVNTLPPLYLVLDEFIRKNKNTFVDKHFKEREKLIVHNEEFSRLREYGII